MHRSWLPLVVAGVCGGAFGAAMAATEWEIASPEGEIGAESFAIPGVTGYSTMCNASAAVSMGNGLFVVADDEDKKSTKLRLYRIGEAGKPLSTTAIKNEFLDLKDEKHEVDLEGAAAIGDRVYWIGSHSAGGDGEPEHNRRRLFATRLKVKDGKDLEIDEVDKPYKHLIHDLDKDDQYKAFKLGKAAKENPKLPGALSIEGLASNPDGDLLIGFRNPIIEGKALVVTLKNPKGVMEGKDGKFAEPILLDLGGLGIRSMERKENEYFIVAGRYDGIPDFKLFRWTGNSNDAPTVVPGVDLKSLNPEALFFEGPDGYILSDDGKMQIGGKSCEKLDKELRLFRGFGFKP